MVKIDHPQLQTNKQTNVEAVKPLPKKYAASSGRVVRGTFGGGYVAKALKLAADMRKLAVENDHWYNRTKASDVDEVMNKYRPMIQAARASEKKGLAEEMLAELFDTPTGGNLFWEFRSHPLYQCSMSEARRINCRASGYYQSREETCTVIGFSKTKEHRQYEQNCDNSIEKRQRLPRSEGGGFVNDGS